MSTLIWNFGLHFTVADLVGMSPVHVESVSILGASIEYFLVQISKYLNKDFVVLAGEWEKWLSFILWP